VPNNDAEEEIYAGHMSPTALPWFNKSFFAFSKQVVLT
jgi:hypothetical protein